MIKSIHLRNFFSFKDQVVEFGSTNFLVGINGSGKSNLIKAFRLLKASLVEGDVEDLIINKWGGFDAVYHKGLELSDCSHFYIEYEFDPVVLREYGYPFQEPVYYKLCFDKVASTQNYSLVERFCTKQEGKAAYHYFSAKHGRGWAMEGERTDDQHRVNYMLDNETDSMLSQLKDSDRYPQISTLRRAISDIAIYTYFNTTETSPIRKPASPTTSTKLSSDGSNLPQLLNWININFKKEYRAIKASLNAINPNISDINFHPLNTNIELLLEEDVLNSAVHVAHVSDGTLRFLCLMAIIHNPKRGRFVCIDEPEVGLHPDMIRELMDDMEVVGCSTQYLLSTHSELVLNQTTIDNVLVCEKDQDNATQINTFKSDEYKEWAADYATGELWRNGDLGGNRY